MELESGGLSAVFLACLMIAWELDILKKTFKKVSEAIQIAITNGRDRAMNTFN